MTIAFLPLQPHQSAEYTLDIDKDMIAAMNHWRLAQTPELSPNAAILELLRKALVAEGYFPDPATPTEIPNELTDAFRQILAANR